ncbi:hypothetical protein Ancab_019406 [Ancistrocladus abbreviatus]
MSNVLQILKTLLLLQVFEGLDVPKKKIYSQSGEILSIEKLIAEAYLAINKAVKVGTLRTRNYKENHSLQEERRQWRSTLAGITLLLLQWLLHRTHFDSATVIMSSMEGVIDQHGLDDSLETNEEIITVPRELWSWDVQTHCSSLERNIGRTLINLNGKLRRLVQRAKGLSLQAGAAEVLPVALWNEKYYHHPNWIKSG